MKKKLITKLFALLLISITILTSIGGFSNVSAASGHSYCAGYVESGRLNTTTMVRNAYNTYKSMGYSSTYTLSPSYNTLASGKFSDGRRYLESDVILLAGHGLEPSGTELYLNTLNSGIKTENSTNSLIGINSINFSNVKLITYAACYSAYNNNSLSDQTFCRGAKNVVGFRQSIASDSMQKWLDRYNSGLKSGKSVWDAVAYANQINYNDSRVKDIGFYGSHTSTVNSVDIPVVMSNINELAEDNTYPVYENIIFTQEKQDIDSISNYLASKHSNFSNEDYEIQVYEINAEQNLYTIDYIREINGFKTDLGYVVTVECGKVKSITDNNKEVSIQQSELLTREDVKESEMETYKQKASSNLNKKYARNNDNIIESIDIISQDTQLYLDVNTNKQYYKIFTTYKGNNGFIDVDYSLIEL